ncbi:MAG TPA: hypothetical protein VK427_23805 [Kofleriaceae bacterium]|nr:hypothetical protein [Kofleriaceae bacterium]
MLLERIGRCAGQRGDAHDEMGELVRNLRDQYEAHRFLVTQLRATYSAAGIADSQWRVSVNKHAERKDLDIDGERFMTLYEDYRNGRHAWADTFSRDGDKELSATKTETLRY